MQEQVTFATGYNPGNLQCTANDVRLTIISVLDPKKLSSTVISANSVDVDGLNFDDPAKVRWGEGYKAGAWRARLRAELASPPDPNRR